MSNESKRIFLKGSSEWNEWKLKNPHLIADLSGIRFSNMDFGEYNLRNVNLSGTHITNCSFVSGQLYQAELYSSYLDNIDFTKADLRGAKFHDSNINKVNFQGANLYRTDFIETSFKNTSLSGAFCYLTAFANVDLSQISGLNDVLHRGPSNIDVHTLAKSKNIGDKFLYGCGFSDKQILVSKLFNENLSQYEIEEIKNKLYNYVLIPPIQFYSCFISYSTKDESFVKKIYDDLIQHKVRSWYAPEDMKIGDSIRNTIDSAIHMQDKLLLVLSSTSVNSQWVEQEVEKALDKERSEKRLVLFPIRLDDAIFDTDIGWASYLRRTRHIGDFRDWQEENKYNTVFSKLLDSLKFM